MNDAAVADPLAALFPAGSLIASLRDGCAADWQRYVAHPFVRGLADGSLPEAAFRHYLVQDYLFLLHFARAYALAVYKADDLDDMRQAAAMVAALVDDEMKLHVKYCAGWGMREAAMAAAPEDPACIAYTRYVLERGLAGDLLDLHAALAPCVVGYAEIGARLAADPATRLDGNPYRDWIEMYAGEDYQQVARTEVAQLDKLYSRRGGPGRDAALRQVFATATRLEIGFWQMGLDAAGNAGQAR
jgi:thiaminase/transcriptional activator TenA